jgi:alpha-N-acetylglucosaminidase
MISRQPVAMEKEQGSGMKPSLFRSRRVLICAVAFLLVGGVDAARAAGPLHQDRQTVTSAQGVVKRLLGARANGFKLELIPSENGHDVFEVEGKNGTVVVRGTSAIALTRGVYHYLRYATHSQVTWSGEHLNLPKPLPDYPKTRVSSPYNLRLYYNVCAFGYTTAFWGWKEWERELDWMALHGINMPLAMAGQEAIWQKVWNSYGVTNDELKDYFTGPAFLPWHRMGNINKHDGPLPQGWLDQSRELQKKILRRMRELGMQPVVPAFSGFVPPAFERHHPEVKTQKLASWADFGKEYQTELLAADSPLFEEIGKKFIEEYRKEYGQYHYYLSDSFNEMEVPVTETGRYDELAAYGKAVYNSIVAGDPNGVWVMQGWLFYNDSKFWDKPSVQALLRDVPNDRMIIIDLANEFWHGWKVHDGFYGKEWIYSVIHNFGGNNPLNGALRFFGEDPAKALNDPSRGALVGLGLSPEGVENNEVIYEILTDAGWTGQPIDLDRWLADYCASRYGSYPEAMKEAWQSLEKSVYSRPHGNVRFGFQRRPSLTPRGEAQGGPDVAHACDLFLSSAGSLGSSRLYRNDLAELVVQYAGGITDSLLRKAGEFHRTSRFGLRDTMVAKSLLLMREIDKLLAGRPDRRLERWISDARQWGKNEKEKNYYEADAKRQVTVWGGPVLSEYAAKVWSGLIRDYYADRWRLYYKSLKEGKSFDLRQWEEKWIVTPNDLSRERKVADLVRGSRDLKRLTDDIVAKYLALK